MLGFRTRHDFTDYHLGRNTYQGQMERRYP